MPDQIERKIQAIAFSEVATLARKGAFVYLLLWVPMALAAGLHQSYPVFTLANTVLMALLGALRWLALRRFDERYARNAPKATLMMAIPIYLAGLQWGCLGAFILLTPALEGILLPFFICLVGLAAITSFYFSASVIFGLLYYAFALMPIIVLGLIADSRDTLLVSAVMIAYLVGAYIRGKSTFEKQQESFRKAVLFEQRMQQLEALSNRDSLTGLPDAGNFTEQLHQEWKRAYRNQTPLSLLLLDINGLDEINSQYGQKTGDLCIKAVAHCLDLALQRPGDLGGRLEGKTLIAMLPETSATGARQFVEHLLKKISGLSVEVEGTATLALHVTIGVYNAVPFTGERPQQALEHARTALINARQNGLNTYQIFCSSTRPQSLEVLSSQRHGEAAARR